MDALSDMLQPYTELIGSVAAIVAIGPMFSGSYICYHIYKQGNTKGIGLMSFIGGMIISVLGLRYATLLRDDKMIKVNYLGLAINIIYLMIYFKYTEQILQEWAKLGFGGAISAILIGYAEMGDPTKVEYRFGVIMTTCILILIASALFGLKDIIKNKSTEGMPFPIIVSGTVATFVWLIYGICLKNQFLLIQNIVALVLCAAQLSLFVIYPSKPKVQEDKKSN